VATGGDASRAAAGAPGAPRAAPAGWPRLARLGAIGVCAGFFSALFGVGGGIVVVPMLILLLAYDARVATATSLAAIIFIAAFGAAVYAWRGHLEWREALLVGLPGVLGLLGGLAIKARLSSRALTLTFAAVLVGIAVKLALS
jgi:uncharacterized membrane protein YfcA